MSNYDTFLTINVERQESVINMPTSNNYITLIDKMAPQKCIF